MLVWSFNSDFAAASDRWSQNSEWNEKIRSGSRAASGVHASFIVWISIKRDLNFLKLTGLLSYSISSPTMKKTRWRASSQGWWKPESHQNKPHLATCYLPSAIYTTNEAGIDGVKGDQSWLHLKCISISDWCDVLKANLIRREIWSQVMADVSCAALNSRRWIGEKSQSQSRSAGTISSEAGMAAGILTDPTGSFHY